jgi:hypothetical protein
MKRITLAVREVSCVRRSRMRGVQLQTAVVLVAERKLSGDEIAKVLNVRLSALVQAMAESYFARRVEEMRSATSPRISLGAAIETLS